MMQGAARVSDAARGIRRQLVWWRVAGVGTAAVSWEVAHALVQRSVEGSERASVFDFDLDLDAGGADPVARANDPTEGTR
jgi:hypothetical protein